MPGKDLQLTIDLDLQTVAELAMDGKSGSVVALDPRSGEVLAMVSRPTFDPNKFTVRIKTKDWREIADNPDHPLLNRAIQAEQAPGSTFKPLVALSGLETGTVDDKWSVHCSGGVALYGTYQRCWVPHGHGTLAMHSGIVHSCDVFFTPSAPRSESTTWHSTVTWSASGRPRESTSAREDGAHAVGEMEAAQLPDQVVRR